MRCIVTPESARLKMLRPSAIARVASGLRPPFRKVKMNDVADITPPSEPIALAREMVSRAAGTKAGLAVLVRENGTLWYDMAGHERAYIMWALQRMVHELMEGDIEEVG